MDLFIVGFVFQNQPSLGTVRLLCRIGLCSVTGGSRAWAIFNDYVEEIYENFWKCDNAGDFAKPSLSQKSRNDSLIQRSWATNPSCSQWQRAQIQGLTSGWIIWGPEFMAATSTQPSWCDGELEKFNTSIYFVFQKVRTEGILWVQTLALWIQELWNWETSRNHWKIIAGVLYSWDLPVSEVKPNDAKRFLRPVWNRDFYSSLKVSDVKQKTKERIQITMRQIVPAPKQDQRKQCISLERFRSGSWIKWMFFKSFLGRKIKNAEFELYLICDPRM